MNKNLTAIILLLTSALCSKAQDSTHAALLEKLYNPRNNFYDYSAPSINSYFNEKIRSDAENRITVDFDYQLNSNAAPANLTYKLLFKGPVNNNLKDRTNALIKNQLKFEDYMKTGISYRRYLRKWDGEIFLGYHHRQYRFLIAPKDAFQTVFYGNAMFEDKTADFSNLAFTNNIYNQYSIGLNKTFTYAKYQMEFGATLSLLQIINFQEAKTKKTTLYTAPDGEYIEANYDLTFNTVKEGAAKFTDLNGLGMGADFHLAFQNNDKWRVSLDVMDFGRFSSRKTPVNYSAAKNIKFQGVVLPDLLNFSAQTFDTLNLDSALRSNLPSKSGNRFSVLMPFSAQLVFSKPLLQNKLVVSAGIMYRHLPRYYAYGFAKLNYFIKPDMVFSTSVGAGGYSLFNLGVDFSKSWKYFDFTIGTSNLLGLVAPSHMPGTSVYLRLASSF